MKNAGEMQPAIDELNRMAQENRKAPNERSATGAPDREAAATEHFRQPEQTRIPSAEKKLTRGARPKHRGVFERKSRQWWARYVDANGVLRREKGGTFQAACALYIKRKNQALEGKKLPEKLRCRVVPFSELADDALEYAKTNARHVNEKYRILVFKHQFGHRAAESIPLAGFREFFDAQNWKAETYNRNRTTLFSIYKLGFENKKVTLNPAKGLKRQKVAGGRTRFLNQFEPLPTEIEYLKPFKTEEERLLAVFGREYPEHFDEFIIAINTGMRRSEQYTRIDWSCIDLARKDLWIPQSKTGKARHIPLNTEARAAFERLRKGRFGAGPIPIAPEGPIFVGRGGVRLLGPRHWFEDAVKKAGLRDFTWHDLRHTFASNGRRRHSHRRRTHGPRNDSNDYALRALGART